MASLGTVGVVIPAYNAARTVGAAVASALAAGAGTVLVVDDGSADATGEVAASAGALVLRQDNAGAAAARMAGLDAIATPMVAFLDADDELVAEGLFRSASRLALGGVSGVLGGVVGIDGAGGEKTLGALPPEITARWLVARGYAPRPPVAVLWSTDVLREAVARTDPPALAPAYAEDYELMIRGALQAPLATHDAPAARYRMTGGKSDAHPDRSAAAAMDIASHYAEAVGLRAPASTPRRVRAQLLIREATSRSAFTRDPQAWAPLARASMLSPSRVWRWASFSARARAVT